MSFTSLINYVKIFVALLIDFTTLMKYVKISVSQGFLNAINQVFPTTNKDTALGIFMQPSNLLVLEGKN